MAAFPLAAEFMYGFKFAPRSGVAMNESVGGTADVRNMYGTRRSGQWAGPMILTSTQLASLISHYEGDYANEFDFADPETDNTYTVIYGDPGVSQPVKVGPDAYSVVVNLERVKLNTVSLENLTDHTGDNITDHTADPIVIGVS